MKTQIILVSQFTHVIDNTFEQWNCNVSLLIGYVMGKDGYDACPICADVNADGQIDIDDVAVLINIALGKNQASNLQMAKPGSATK